MKYKIILTGGIGSGKSTVANFFAKIGISVIDSDTIAKQVTAKETFAWKEIIKKFSEKIIYPDGSLNRKKLRERIFNNYEERIWLNNLIHPLINQLAQKKIHNANSPYVIWVIPLFFEYRNYRKINRILTVDVSPKIQIERVIQRDNVSRSHVKQIISAQVRREERLDQTDDIINNDGTLNNVISNVIKLHKQYLQLCNKVIL